MVAGRRRFEAWALAGPPLAILAVLLFVDLFLPWTGSNLVAPCGPASFPGAAASHIYAPLCSSGTANGLGGSGIAAACFAMAIVAFESLRLARVQLPFSMGYRSLISAGLTFALLLFTVLDLIPAFGQLVSHPTAMPFLGAFAWLALALAVVIALFGVVHWGIWLRSAPAAPAPPPPPQREEPPRCPGCGRRTAPGAVFCAHCGRQLSV